MAMNVRLGVFFTRFKPHILVIFAQVGYTFMYFFTDASFKHGMNPHVHITYRQIVASVGMFPLAYFFERKTRPRMTVTLFLEIFVLSLLGMEIVDLKNPRGIAKVVGTLVSLGGVMIMTFYKGPIIRNLWHPFIHIQHKASNLHENWLKGSLLTVSSCISWALSYIMQAFTLKRYPAQLSLSTWMNLVGAAQSGVFAVLTQHKPGVWSVGLNIDLWCIIYSGIVCSALTVYIQLWCTEEKGPVFVTMFDPLCTVLVAALAYFVFGQKLYMGSIVGGGIVIMGLYMLLWGKEHDKFELQNKSQLESDSVHETFNQPDLQISASPPPNHVLQHQP
ncbi:WAT1-related protein At4g08290-like isoform X2 [Cucurbita pepo subsp. pepo]|uniref:WAT1-related protein n=1 Tax=Cucurbita moschata TaxID=3662 RepID=A0A6J1EQV0_CUCMO|nr:WAT1-related protein At4g08290-like isoform X2 [Cucurbita moschata]XP_023514004.1 WAT1-related protein At4g08290-like isoform X2 [Cucurbita pepo subsp. pepo]